MSTAEELLAAAQEDGTMTIDGELRTISIPSGYEILGVESDDDVNRIRFRGPRYYHGLDLSKFDVRVNIENAKGDLDMFPVNDLAAEDDAITFTWLVGRYTAQYQGSVTFSLCFREIDSQGVITREFNTTTATGVILEGLETSGVIIQQNPDIIENILLRLDTLENSQTIENILLRLEYLENGQVLGDEHVTSVNGVKPDATGNVTIEVGSDDAVTSVNGVKPDSTGNVELPVPTGTVTSVNGVNPDENGNVTIDIPESGGSANAPTTIGLDFTNWTNGSFTETLSDGTTNVYVVTFDEANAPISIGGITITGVSDLA